MIKANFCIKNDVKGSALILLAVLLPLVLIILVFSVDLNNGQTAKAGVQNALDMTALHTTEWILKGKIAQLANEQDMEQWKRWKPSDAEITNYAFSVFTNQIGNNYKGLSGVSKSGKQGKFEVIYNDSSHEITITSCSFVTPTSFAASLGRESELEICAKSKAGFTIDDEIQPQEIAFSIDITGSMVSPNNTNSPNDRFAKLINALNGANGQRGIIEKYLENKIDPECVSNPNQDKCKRVKYSIVPFNDAVWLNNYEDAFINTDASYPGLSDSSFPGVRYDKWTNPSYNILGEKFDNQLFTLNNDKIKGLS